MKNKLIIIVMVSSTLIIGCATHITTTDWLADIPFEQGVVQVSLGQEKAFGSVSIRPYGLFSIRLSSFEKIQDFNLLTSDVRLRLLKNGDIVKEHKIYPEPYSLRKNRILGVICSYTKYITPDIEKKYCLNWDEFTEAVKVSDKIEFSIILKFEANGQLYSIQKTRELKKDVKRDLYWGIYD